MKRIKMVFLVIGLVFGLASAAQAATAYAVFSFFNNSGKLLESHTVNRTGAFKINSTTGLFANFMGSFSASGSSTKAVNTTAALASPPGAADLLTDTDDLAESMLSEPPAGTATSYAIFSFFSPSGKLLESHTVNGTGSFSIPSTTGLFTNFMGSFSASGVNTKSAPGAAVTPLPGSLLLLGSGLLGLAGLRWRKKRVD